MALFKKPKSYTFGPVSASDDTDIHVYKLKKASRSSVWVESLRLLRDIILIIAIFVLFGVFVAQPVVVDGESMVPELHDGERLLVNKLVYYDIKRFDWGHIERGDIVVFWYPDDPEKSFVKRVIGLPGELVEVRKGKVYINDRPLDEPYISPKRNRSTLDYSARRVSEHYYFVMGDNRDNSLDSRMWGLVPEKYIYGRAFFRYWRPSKIGVLHRGAAKLEGRPKNMPSDQLFESGDPRAQTYDDSGNYLR